ncbi:GNAT family N-acetyltransferase [Dermatobacter hominis]|uniref:GNAT family N-acetyltransferase n=1 Tax=Dermatobacter hominis TaxID=2884263 RepID=UPI001D11F542|nr:GNAT family N-acetyltransferase [Dermatobacter hominis]UDY37445.1 GNAT family N-acetyltransferase [Dermatobacter hominis]
MHDGFRLATTDDVDELVPLVHAAYRGEATDATWTTETHLIGGQRTDRDMVLDAITGPDAAVLVLVDEADDGAGAGRIVACCELGRPDARGRSLLGMFAVDPGRQSSGLGRRTLAAGERLAAEWGAAAVELHVIDVRHELIDWYRRRGYELTGERLPFPYDDDRFGMPRRDDLRFAVLVKRLPGRS